MADETARLAEAIVAAARAAFLSLFANEERFYCCALVTTGEGHFPFVSAWSWEALEREAAGTDDPEKTKGVIQWSFADSPYCAYGEEHFVLAKELFNERPSIDELDEDAWDTELRLRLNAMENAMKKLDGEGLFSRNLPRESVVATVAFMTPDAQNGVMAARLNQPSPLLGEYIEVVGTE